MEGMSEYPKILSYFLWMSLFCVLCIQWCKGLLDGRSMITFFSIIIAVAVGYSVLKGMMQAGTLHSGNDTNFSCVNENDAYYSCMGWPIMKDGFSVDAGQNTSILLNLANTIIDKIKYIFTFALGYAQIIAVIILYSKLTRSIWTYEPKEIIFAFVSGGIIYLSLANAGYLQKIFMEMTMYLYGIESRSGGNDNLISNVSMNLQNWHKSLTDLVTINEDMSLFSSKIISLFLEGFIFSSLRFLIMIPLSLFSFVNIIMMIVYQILVMTLPIDAIKMSMNHNVDPMFIVKKLYSLALLSIVVVVEFQILSWIPTAPIVPELVGTIGNSGMIFKLFSTMIPLIFVIIMCIIFALSIIFFGIKMCTNSIRQIKI